MRLSIIIVNYNVRYFLEQCLNSVFKAIAKVDAEVFVVDNNSVDGSCEMIIEKFPRVKLIANKENKGFAFANNQAVKLATGDYILLLNPDTLVEEDTFTKCIQFMDAHEDAGGLGVYMIDGKGKFLPESKRGLPSPLFAFYKIFGLSALFPKSKTFGRYHLGYLDKNQTHVVDVLSGAFMMMRKRVLDKIGLLDETFFMYGEDIDLSYRITQAGFKNYYFPETKIIHYKGESTKKSSVNYVIVFYKAMVIFARKHFTKNNVRLFSVLINLAVYLRAGIAIINRFIKTISVPVVDALLIYGGFRAIQFYWENNIKAFHYPHIFDWIVVPGYMIFWIFSVWLSGGYDKPIRISKVLRGILSGSVLILVVYSLLPETMRFSRALILLGTGWACLITALTRLILSALGVKLFSLASSEKKRAVIVGNEMESKRVLSLLQMTEANLNFIGYVRNSNELQQVSNNEFELGNLNRLNELTEIYKIDEVIFCAKDISSNEIINHMLEPVQHEIEYKIAPEESLFIIGSNSINDKGKFYFVDLNVINKPVNRRNKRLLDVLISLSLLITFPINIFLIKNYGLFIQNLFNVLNGKISWVGFATSVNHDNKKSKPGILTPIDGLRINQLDSFTIDRLNMLYAKEYDVYVDLNIISKNIRLLGRKIMK